MMKGREQGRWCYIYIYIGKSSARHGLDAMRGVQWRGKGDRPLSLFPFRLFQSLGLVGNGDRSRCEASDANRVFWAGLLTFGLNGLDLG